VGVDGLVTINRLQPNTELQVIDVPQEVAESEEVVALACSTADGEDRSEFIITGRGGLPPRPSEPLSSEALVSFDSSPARAGNQPAAEIPSGGPSAAHLPAPARGWYINPEGVTILTAQAPSPLPYSSGLTTSKCHGN
jgi:large exoprotein involved in heme utilization and adhesion